MSIEQRRHIRFSLEIPAFRQNRYGEMVETIMHQISIGGCLLEWDENLFVGDEVRLLAQLPNKNYLPLNGRALYIFPNNGIGVRFPDITQFEQELLAKIIAHSLEKKGMPGDINPFAQPRKAFEAKEKVIPRIEDPRKIREEILEDILGVFD